MLVIALIACLAQAPRVEAPSPSGAWEAWLESPGGKLHFELLLSLDGESKPAAHFANEGEIVAVPVVHWSSTSRELVLGFEPYESRITATTDDDGHEMSGSWRKRKGAQAWTEMRFGARKPSVTANPAAAEARRARVRASISSAGDPHELWMGAWSVRFASDAQASIAVFQHAKDGCFLETTPDRFAGTFLTTLGDYRYLSGVIGAGGDRISLSCFDGAHAFLFKAKMLEDGSLEGEFWSGDSWHDTWKAVRDDHAALPDPFGLTKTVKGVQLDELSFPDVDGVARKLGDERFAGKARLVQLFGTWCPNCNDETRYLRELDQRYRERGLSIVGLAFELTGDFERDAGQVRKYAAHHDIAYPLLVAGVSDKKKASERFPLLDRVRAYPTTLFVDAAGRVRAVHQGFSGPATGREHQKLREDFERLIETMLAETR